MTAHRFAPLSAILFCTVLSATITESAVAAPLAMMYYGAWVSTTKYQPGYVVTYNGASYISLVTNTGITPPSNTTDWGILDLPGALADGRSDTATGFFALRANTVGANNTAFGFDALENTTGSGNTGSGTLALQFNTTGNYNTASGNAALIANNTGSYNTASGNAALENNTTGNNNVAVGAAALLGTPNVATGSYNTAVGSQALFSYSSGQWNTASGYQALYSNTTGSYNTASGEGALFSNTTGSLNAASGEHALYFNTTGSANTASGPNALFHNITGGSNTAVGNQAGLNNTDGNNNIWVGNTAGNLTTGSSNIDIGNSGAAVESGTIRIGTVGIHTKTYFAGINTSLIGDATALPVVVDTVTGQLGLGALVMGPPGLPGTNGTNGTNGATGATGLTGPAGPAGQNGAVGPIGPAGAPGAMGPAGATGPAGAAGATGAPGAGVITCTNEGDVAVVHGGTWVCQSALPRYVDNGDGTVTDNKTGLMWEQKDGTCASPGPHCWTNLYALSATGTAPDGTLFTDFLATLNANSSYDAPFCFANHCDWRIPTIGELQAIISPWHACTMSPCIDPIFGPTQDSNYWSSTSLTGQPGVAWIGLFNAFNGGAIDHLPENTALYARAVRGGR